MSLRRTLILVLITMVVASFLAALLWSYSESSDELNEVFDGDLVQTASLLNHLERQGVPLSTLEQVHEALANRLPVRIEDDNDKDIIDFLLPSVRHHQYQREIAFQIWDANLHPLIRGPKLLDDSPLKPGFGQVYSGGQDWRTFTLHDHEDHLWIRTAQRVELRQSISTELALGNSLPLLLTLPVLVLLVMAAIWWAFRPLVRLENHIDGMDPGALEHLDEKLAPREVRGLVRAINALLNRLSHALEREKQFTANAAHELRTPLTALRLNLEDKARAQPEQTQPLLAAVDRMVHLVEQMLILSRLDPEEPATLEACDLHQLTTETLAEMAPVALQANKELQLEARPPIACMGNPTLLTTMIRNLVNNALQYSQPHSVVEVQLEQQANTVILKVCDQGPGIAPEHREQVLQRFVRLDGRRGQGAGLGLAIVQRITQLHQGSLVLSDRPDGMKGLCVTVILPAD